MIFNDPNHPNVNDHPQGTTIFWSESNPEQIEITIWTRYSSATGEYHATNARFSIDRKAKSLHLEHVSIKYPHSSWTDIMTNPSSFVTDKMKRYLRSFIAKETGSAYWRIFLIN